MILTVTAGPHEYRNCPVEARIGVRDLGYGEASLVREDGSRVPCQLFPERGEDHIAWIEPHMAPGETKTYRFETAPVGVGNRVEIEDIGDGKLEVRIGGKLLTRYHYGHEWPRPFLYPFIGPGDAAVTRHYPMREDVPDERHDHPHHRSVWVAYGEINGTDNWSENEGHACMRHRRFEEVTGGPIFGRIRSVNSWVSSEGAKQMEDVREFTFYYCESERLVDVDVRFLATDGDVHIGDTKEGGVLSVRVASSMDGDRGGMIVNSRGGVTEAQTWGKPAEWVDYSGPVGDKTMGITIMDSPVSFRYPSRWHVRDYGLFTANPFALKYYEPDKGVNGDHTIPSGGEIGFKYRVYVHDGNTEQAQVKERYDDFVLPPEVDVEVG
jgi:hypothetical protein